MDCLNRSKNFIILRYSVRELWPCFSFYKSKSYKKSIKYVLNEAEPENRNIYRFEIGVLTLTENISGELWFHIKIKKNKGRIIAGVVDCGRRKIVIAANP